MKTRGMNTASSMPELLRKFINLVPVPLLIKEGKFTLYYLHWHDCRDSLQRPQQRRGMGVMGEACCKMRPRGRPASLRVVRILPLEVQCRGERAGRYRGGRKSPTAPHASPEGTCCVITGRWPLDVCCCSPGRINNQDHRGTGLHVPAPGGHHYLSVISTGIPLPAQCAASHLSDDAFLHPAYERFGHTKSAGAAAV